MIYQSEGKYYIKLSGYLIEVKPFLKDGVLDFETTQNKIEITANTIYKAVKIDDLRNELKIDKINKLKTDDEFDSKPKKVNERTHNKFKFDYKD
jgi:hypothetical protein